MDRPRVGQWEASTDPLSRGVKRSYGLPPDIATMMDRFGRHEIDPMASTDDKHAVLKATQDPLIPFAIGDQAGFVRALADLCIPVGGWTVFGAERTVVNLIGTAPAAPDWGRLLDASNDFLRRNFVPPMRVPGYAWDRFIDTGGTSNTWIVLRKPPERDSVVLAAYSDGEIRRVAKLGPAPDANLLLVQRRGDQYFALIDSRQSDDDPTHSQFEWKHEANLYDLYFDVAWSTQVWDWADPDLEAFFPAPKALI